jgi:hypothetical protein
VRHVFLRCWCVRVRCSSCTNSKCDVPTAKYIWAYIHVSKACAYRFSKVSIHTLCGCSSSVTMKCCGVRTYFCASWKLPKGFCSSFLAPLSRLSVLADLNPCLEVSGFVSVVRSLSSERESSGVHTTPLRCSFAWGGVWFAKLNHLLVPYFFFLFNLWSGTSWSLTTSSLTS